MSDHDKYRKIIEQQFDGKLRVTLRTAGHKLNVSTKTARRYLDNNKLKWAGNQVSVVSIIEFMLSESPKDAEAPEEIERMAVHAVARRRVISSGIRV